eukprot:scpid75239/ scgid14373/ 
MPNPAVMLSPIAMITLMSPACSRCTLVVVVFAGAMVGQLNDRASRSPRTSSSPFDIRAGKAVTARAPASRQKNTPKILIVVPANDFEFALPVDLQTKKNPKSDRSGSSMKDYPASSLGNPIDRSQRWLRNALQLGKFPWHEYLHPSIVDVGLPLRLKSRGTTGNCPGMELSLSLCQLR